MLSSKETTIYQLGDKNMHSRDKIENTDKSRTAIKAILFDWDNTVVDTQIMVLKALNKTLGEMNKPTLHSYINAPERMAFFKQTFGEECDYAYSLFVDNLKSESPESIRIFPGFISFLELIAEKGIFTGVVSNKHSGLLRREIDSLGLTERFNIIVGSGDTDQDKPSPKPLLYALSTGGITPCTEAVFFIGDSAVDMECAKNASVRGIAYRSVRLEGFEDIQSIQSYEQAKNLIL